MSRLTRLFRKQKTPSKNDLLRILYARLTHNTPVIFYDFEKDDFIKEGYRSNAEVYKIVRKIVEKCNVPPTYIYEEVSDKKYRKYSKFTKAFTPTDNAKGILYRAKGLRFLEGESDLLNLIERPNSYQSYAEMMELFRIFYFVQGEAFIYRETAKNSDIALSLHVAPANLMTPIYSSDAERIISGWKLNMFSGFERELDAADVFHLRMSNPYFTEDGQQLRGQSPLLAGLKYLQLDDKSIQAWIKTVENEGAKGIVSPNHSDPNLWLTPEQVTTTEKSMQEKIHGIDNKNKVVVSGMPLQYVQIGMSPDSMQLIEALNHSQVNLADLWGVPATLFEPNPTYQNQQAATRRFVGEVIIPYLEKEEKALNNWLVKPFSERDGKNYYLDNDTSVFEELKMSFDEIQALKEVLTINEIRIIIGYDEIENEYANEVFVTQGKIPLSDYSVSFEI